MRSVIAVRNELPGIDVWKVKVPAFGYPVWHTECQINIYIYIDLYLKIIPMFLIKINLNLGIAGSYSCIQTTSIMLYIFARRWAISKMAF